MECASGDLGNNTKDNLYQSLLAHRRSIFGAPDAIVVESTYGGRPRAALHKSHDARIEALRDLLQRELFDRKALLVIPAFALQRTQEVLVDLVVVLLKFFSTAEQSTAPYLPRSPYFDHFNEGHWSNIAQDAIRRAIGALPEGERGAWFDAIEGDFGSGHPFRLKPGCGRSLDDVRALIEEGREVYPVDITVDSRLARAMGAVIRDELKRRRPHKQDEHVYLNPELASRLGAAGDEELEAMLAALLPDPGDPFTAMQVGDHTIRYAQGFALPSYKERLRRGTVVLTGGGMCEGGPVVSHLEEVATKRHRSVLVQTGFMPRASLGARLVEVAQARQAQQPLPTSPISIGRLTNVPPAEILLGAADLSAFYSGHADREGLLEFLFETDGRRLSEAGTKPATVFINHGNPNAREALKAAIEERQAAGHVDDRLIGRVELAEADRRAFDLEDEQWVEAESEKSVEQLLGALLREQIKTNALLERLVRGRSEQPAPYKHPAKKSQR